MTRRCCGGWTGGGRGTRCWTCSAPEPLPEDHPFWAHPAVTVTPHIAAETRPATAAPVVAQNLRRAMAGRPLLHLVDRDRGY